MSVSARIREAASLKSLNIKAFAEVLGVSYRTIQNYLAEDRGVGSDFLTACSTKLGISATWLLTGLGAPLMDEKHSIDVGPTTEPEFVTVPRYAVEASAGHGALPGDEETTGFYAFNRKWLARRGLNPDRLSIISVKGDSMEPGFCNNDLILVDHDQTRPSDGLIFVFRIGDDLFVKHVQLLPDGMMHLISANKLYPPIAVNAAKPAAGFQVIGRVVASMHEW
jgi:phage repressor protein C with HTH and peptisase S24 domain